MQSLPSFDGLIDKIIEQGPKKGAHKTYVIKYDINAKLQLDFFSIELIRFMLEHLVHLCSNSIIDQNHLSFRLILSYSLIDCFKRQATSFVNELVLLITLPYLHLFFKYFIVTLL